MADEKQCTKCKEIFPLSGFHYNHHTPDGHQYWCKRCTNQRARHNRSNRKNLQRLVFQPEITV